MTDREELLANAAVAIREQAEAQKVDDKRKEGRMQPPDGTAPSGVEPAT